MMTVQDIQDFIGEMAKGDSQIESIVVQEALLFGIPPSIVERIRDAAKTTPVSNHQFVIRTLRLLMQNEFFDPCYIAEEILKSDLPHIRLRSFEESMYLIAIPIQRLAWQRISQEMPHFVAEMNKCR